MPRPRKPPRLDLRNGQWVIRDGQIYRRTGFRDAQVSEAQAVLQRYVSQVYGSETAASLLGTRRRAEVRSIDDLTVYLIGDGEFVKIGIATNLRARLADIQAYCARELHLYGTLRGGMRTERRLHKQFAAHRVRGEWFRIEGALLDFMRSLPDLSKMTGFTADVPDSRHSSAKLTREQVELIRQNPSGLSGSDFARLFGVGAATISQIKTGVWWKHVA